MGLEGYIVSREANTGVKKTKRRRVIARLVPPEPEKRVKRPDFLARLKKMYDAKTLKVSGAALLAQERSRY